MQEPQDLLITTRQKTGESEVAKEGRKWREDRRREEERREEDKGQRRRSMSSRQKTRDPTGFGLAFSAGQGDRDRGSAQLKDRVD